MTGDAAPAPATPPAPPDDARLLALCSDGRRSRRAVAHAVILPSIALGVMLIRLRPDGHWWAATVVLLLVGFNLYVLAYTVLTWRVFAYADPETFKSRMAARQGSRRRGVERLLPRGDGPSFAITSTAIAFGSVLLIPHLEAVRVDDWLLVPISLTILMATWGLSVVSYALHYAQYDLASPALEFPGERTGAFSDYVYFAIGVATTLGVTDVNITSPQMRRIVNFNVIVAFLFNSVVVALLASILIR